MTQSRDPITQSRDPITQLPDYSITRFHACDYGLAQRPPVEDAVVGRVAADVGQTARDAVQHSDAEDRRRALAELRQTWEARLKLIEVG